MKHILTITFLLSFSIIFSQEEDQLLVTELKQTTIVTQPSTLHKGFFKLSAIYNFGIADKIFTDNGNKELFTNNGWAKSATYMMSVQYGLTNRLEISMDMPYETSAYFYSQRISQPLFKESSESNWDLKGSGIGDLNVGMSYQLIEGSKSKPSLVTRVTAVIPTGEKNPTNIDPVESWKYDLPTGYGETTLTLDVIYRKIFFPFSYTFDGSITYSFGGTKMMRTDEEEIDFRSGNVYNLGGSMNFMLNDWIAIQNRVSFFYSQEDEFKGETEAFDVNSWHLSYMPLITFQLKRFRFVEGIIFPLIGKSATADPIYIIIAQYIF